jgi:predicted nucleic acid-binding protein
MVEHLLIDTNVLVRFFIGEPIKQASRVRALVEKADAEEVILVITPLIVAETIFTLESFYKMDRWDVAMGLIRFLKSRGMQVLEKEIVLDALERHRHHKISIADTYLAATAASSGYRVASFDKDFAKFVDVKRYDWSLLGTD